MTRQARQAKQITEEKLEPTENSPELIKKQAMARFNKRKARNSNFDNFNKRLDIDLDLFKEMYPGMHPKWVKDDGSKLQRYFDMGWDYVPADDRIAIGDEGIGRGNTDIGGKISVIGGKDRDRAEGAYRLFLMMIPEEAHQEILAAKQKKNNAKDEEIHRLLRGGGESLVEGAYVPDGEGSHYRP